METHEPTDAELEDRKLYPEKYKSNKVSILKGYKILSPEARREGLKRRTHESAEGRKNEETERKRKIKESHQEGREKDPEKYKRGKSRKVTKLDEVPEIAYYPKNQNYINIPMELIVSKVKFSFADLAVYGFINCYADRDGLYLTNIEIAVELKMSKHTISRAIKKLKELGLIDDEAFRRPWAPSGRTLKPTGNFTKIGKLARDETPRYDDYKDKGEYFRNRG